MIPEIRSGVLSADVGYSDESEEESDEKGIKEVFIYFNQRIDIYPIDIYVHQRHFPNVSLSSMEVCLLTRN